MGRYIENSTNIIKSYAQWKTESNASLPKDGTNIILGDKYLIHATEKPIYNIDTQKIVEINSVKIGNQHNQTWQIVDLTHLELDEKKKKEKKDKRKDINTIRNNDFKYLQIEHNGYTIEGHEKARAEFNGAVTDIILSRLAGLPDDTITWTTANDKDVVFSYNDIIAIARKIKQKYSDIHKTSRAEKIAL